MSRVVFVTFLVNFLLIISLCSPLMAQSVGVIEGVVTLPTDDPVHRATVLLSPLGRIAETDANGRYRFEGVPAGTYEVAAFR